MLLVVSVARGLFTLAQNYYSESVGHHVGYELRLAFYEKVQRLSFSYHDKIHTGDLITVGLLDLDGVRMFFSTGLVRTVLLTVLIGVGAYLLISTDLLLGLLSLSFVPFVAWRSSAAQLTLRATWLTLQDKLSALTRVMEENLGGIRVVRAFSGQKFELAKFDAASAEALQLSHDRVGIRVRNTSAMTFSFFAAMGLVLWFGGNKVIDGQMSIGTLASFLTFMTILQMPVRQLGLMVNSFARASTCGERLFAFLDEPLAIDDAPGAKRPGGHQGHAQVRRCPLHLSRRHPPDARWRELRGPCGPNHRHCRRSRQRQVHPRPPDPALLRYSTAARITIDGQDVSARCRWPRFAAPSPWCSRIRSCSPPPSKTTSPMAIPGPRKPRSSAPPKAPSYTITSWACPWATTRWWANAASRFRAASASACPSRAAWCCKPAVMVFDDSTAAIDAGTEHRIRSAIRRYAKRSRHPRSSPIA